MTLFSLDFDEENMLSQSFTLLAYGNNYINLFYLIGLLFVIYVIHRVYYILIKKNDFLTLSQGDIHDNTMKQLFDSLVQRHMTFIYLFLLTYFPMNFTMIIRMTFGFYSFESYYLNFMTFVFVSLNATIIFCVKLSDPVMRSYIHSLFTRDNKMYDLLNSTLMNQSIMTNESFTGHLHDNTLSSLLVIPEESISNNNYRIEMKEFTKGKHSAEHRPHIKDTKGGIDIKSLKLINPSAKLAKEIPLKQNLFGLKEDYEAIAISDNKSEMSDVSELQTCLSDTNHMLKKRTSSTSISRSCMQMFLKEGYVAFDLLNYHIDLDDNLLRMLAITIALSDNYSFDRDNSYKKLYSGSLPWKENFFYTFKTPWKEYTQDSIPDWVPAKNDPRFKHCDFRVRSFSPLVFHHIQLIDNISIDSLIASLDPIKNLSMIKELKVTGGRSDNPISTSWDKKILIKTISKSEKRLLKHKMLKEYHERMRDTKSLLCRIYGLFKIELNDKGSIHVLLQKNMCELPSKTSLLTFDLKGSTVDRQFICKDDLMTLTKRQLMKKYKDKVLKDTDLAILNMNLNLNGYDGKNLLICVDNDSMFLQKFGVTDYSLLIFIHKYDTKDISNNFANLRIMKSNDKKYLFNFSIIDFLGVSIIIIIFYLFNVFRPSTLRKKARNLQRNL